MEPLNLVPVDRSSGARLIDAAGVVGRAQDAISVLWNDSFGDLRQSDSDRLAGASRALRQAQLLLERADEIG